MTIICLKMHRKLKNKEECQKISCDEFLKWFRGDRKDAFHCMWLKEIRPNYNRPYAGA